MKILKEVGLAIVDVVCYNTFGRLSFTFIKHKSETLFRYTFLSSICWTKKTSDVWMIEFIVYYQWSLNTLLYLLSTIKCFNFNLITFSIAQMVSIKYYLL